MDPGEVPQELKGLTMVEEMLIALACPIMTIWSLKGGYMGYFGKAINMPQCDGSQRGLFVLYISALGVENVIHTLQVC